MRTRLTEMLGIQHPIVLGGMAGATVPEMVAAVSNAGGLGILGASRNGPGGIARLAEALRARTDRFGLNLLLFAATSEEVDAAIAQRPAVLSTAWPWPDQHLRPIFDRAHGMGVPVMHMVSTVAEAERAASAGADVIVAQGTEGGGHVGLIGTMVFVPMVVRAVAPIPVVAAGGIATGAQLAAALVLGAEGAVLGTRFLATHESPWPDSFKRALVESDGHDTELTEIPDIAKGNVWPGAFDRARRNRLIAEWAGREHELRRRRADVAQSIARARADGDADHGELNFGQAAGLIGSIDSCAAVVRRLTTDAEQALATRLPIPDNGV